MTRRTLPLSAVVLLALSFPASAGGQPNHWSYAGAAGPAHWPQTCGSGHAQSPIDIHPAQARTEKLPPLIFTYRPGPLRIVDNGHTIQVDVATGSTLAVRGVRFPLVQFHFHKPGEEAVDGKHTDMVVHFVHRDAEGHLAVVAVPLRAGAANALIAKLWKHIPTAKNHDVSPPGVIINPSELLPADRAYFTYVGSLTTPPCTEGVRWFVLKSATTVSAGEIGNFAKHYPANARPVQPVNGREVLASK